MRLQFEEGELRIQVDEVPLTKAQRPNTVLNGYEHFKGSVWVTEQHLSQIAQGLSVAVWSNERQEFNVIGYIIRKENRYTFDHNQYYTLDNIIRKLMSIRGWKYSYQRHVLAGNID
jgi:hypothetical protein